MEVIGQLRSFTPGNERWFTLSRRLGGPHVGSGRLGEEKHFLPRCATTQIYSRDTIFCSVPVPFNFLRTKLNSSPLTAVNSGICLVVFVVAFVIVGYFS